MRWLTLALAACVHMPHVATAPRDILARMNAAARIEMACLRNDPFSAALDNKGIAIGVDDRHVVTAGHVVRCPEIPIVHVVLSSGRRLRVVVSKEDTAGDLALLTIASADRFHLDLPPPVIAPTPAVGDAWCSFTGSPKREAHCGFVESVNGKQMNADLSGSARTVFGNSGSGVYDVQGRLVGIVIYTDPTDWASMGVTSLAKHRGVLP
jgi:hypothetical protein